MSKATSSPIAKRRHVQDTTRFPPLRPDAAFDQTQGARGQRWLLGSGEQIRRVDPIETCDETVLRKGGFEAEFRAEYRIAVECRFRAMNN
jgi:hypothetical protein